MPQLVRDWKILSTPLFVVLSFLSAGKEGNHSLAGLDSGVNSARRLRKLGRGNSDSLAVLLSCCLVGEQCDLSDIYVSGQANLAREYECFTFLLVLSDRSREKRNLNRPPRV